MGKKEKVLAVFFTLIVLFTVLHSVFHLFVYGTGISGVAETGISGIAVGGSEDFRAELTLLVPKVDKSLSSFVLIGEWVLLMAIGVVFFFRHKMNSDKEFKELNLGKVRKKNTGTSTDLDNLYELLKGRKSLKLSTICKVYGVKKEVVMSWGKILESGKMIKVNYPFLGEPQFVRLDSLRNKEKSVKKVNEDG